MPNFYLPGVRGATGIPESARSRTHRQLIKEGWKRGNEGKALKEYAKTGLGYWDKAKSSQRKAKLWSTVNRVGTSLSGLAKKSK